MIFLIKKLHRTAAMAVAFLLAATSVFAQSNGGIEMADQLRQDGKIWVVVGVILLIFAGITIYLIRLDSKISALEKKIK